MQFMQLAGEEAVGYYMAAYPTFIFFISLVQFGLPIAIAKIVAELYAKKEFPQIANVMKSVFRFSFAACLLLIPILLLLSPTVAKVLLKNEQLTPLLQLAVITIPIVIFAGIFKAYLQGLMKITPTAFAQLLEQIARIALVMLLLPFLLDNRSPIELATFVMGFTLLSECLSFAILFISYYRNRFIRTSVQRYPMSPLLRIALPAQGSKLFGTFTWFLEPIIFLKALTSTGLTVVAATSLYGVISGVHIPLLLFPAFIPAALAIVLIPAVSEGIARQKHASVRHRVILSMRVSSIIGCFACTVFFLYGDELAKSLFHLTSDYGYMKILAPIFYFYYIQSPLHSVLQAVGEAKVAMMNSIYGGVAKLFILFTLASQPNLQEKGAIIAIGFGVVITSILHLVSLRQQALIKIPLTPILFPYSLFIAATIGLSLFPFNIPLYPAIFTTCGLLLIICIITGQIRWRDFTFIVEKLRAL